MFKSTKLIHTRHILKFASKAKYQRICWANKSSAFDVNVSNEAKNFEIPTPPFASNQTEFINFEPVADTFSNSLYDYGFGCSYTPVGWIQIFLENVHNLDLPWWATAVALGVFIRSVTLPINIMARKYTAQFSNDIPRLMKVQQRMKTAMNSRNPNDLSIVAMEMKDLEKVRKNAFKSMLPPIIQMLGIYWLSSNCMAIIFTLLLKNEKIQSMLKIVKPLPMHKFNQSKTGISTPNFIDSLKENYYQAKSAARNFDKYKYNEMQFRKASTSAPVENFDYNQNQMSSVIVRLQNLAYYATAGDVRNFFRGMNIPDGGVHIGIDGDTFIRFSTEDDARRAMMLHGDTLCNQKISLSLSNANEMGEIFTLKPSFTQTQPINNFIPAQQPMNQPIMTQNHSGLNINPPNLNLIPQNLNNNPMVVPIQPIGNYNIYPTSDSGFNNNGKVISHMLQQMNPKQIELIKNALLDVQNTSNSSIPIINNGRRTEEYTKPNLSTQSDSFYRAKRQSPLNDYSDFVYKEHKKMDVKLNETSYTERRRSRDRKYSRERSRRNESDYDRHRFKYSPRRSPGRVRTTSKRGIEPNHESSRHRPIKSRHVSPVGRNDEREYAPPKYNDVRRTSPRRSNGNEERSQRGKRVSMSRSVNISPGLSPKREFKYTSKSSKFDNINDAFNIPEVKGSSFMKTFKDPKLTMEFINFLKEKKIQENIEKANKSYRRDSDQRNFRSFGAKNVPTSRKVFESKYILAENIPRCPSYKLIRKFFGMSVIVSGGIKLIPCSDSKYSSCYIKFASVEDCKIAMRLDKVSTNGCIPLELKFCTVEDFNNYVESIHSVSANGMHDRLSVELNELPEESMDIRRIESRLTKKPSIKSRLNTTPHEFAVCVSMLPPRIKHAHLIDATYPTKLVESWIYIEFDKNGQCLGTAYIRTPTPEELDNIMKSSLSSKPVLGTKLRIKKILISEMFDRIKIHKSKYFEASNTKDHREEFERKFRPADLKYMRKMASHIPRSYSIIVIQNLTASFSRLDAIKFFSPIHLSSSDIWLFKDRDIHSAVIGLKPGINIDEIIKEYNNTLFKNNRVYIQEYFR
ncbi:hypothetical protein A3Q56_01063 [Intoshia linei]|uniref:RRM domain-containing protein n=1 Tax=Intoshia linei TaxID=1819745 RepID=A0A177BC21_9BILA|nr:hypothetical protein A3Q56_01063 [Intoshia linei]